MTVKSGSFGDLASIKCSIAGKDVSEAVISINVFQDITQPGWTAEIGLLDTASAIADMRLRGGEDVSISLQTNQGFDTDGTVNLKMVVNEIADNVMQGQGMQSYVIRCCHKALHKSQETKLCKAYQQKKTIDMIREIAQEMGIEISDKNPKKARPHASMSGGGTRLPADSQGEYNFIAAQMTPLNAIGLLLRSTSFKGNYDFVFHQKSDDGKIFDCQSLSIMWDRPLVTKFVMRPNFIKKNGNYEHNKNLEFSHFVHDPFNHAENIVSGLHDASPVSFELTRKKWKGNASAAAVQFRPLHEQIYQSGKSTIDDFMSSWKNRREQIFKANQSLLKIQCPGQVTSFQWLGEPCEIDVPDSSDGTGSYSGKYMIVAIGHMITRDAYYVNYELARGW